VHERAPLHTREHAAIEIFGVLLTAKHHAAAGAA
jgi:hypothetical protein